MSRSTTLSALVLTIAAMPLAAPRNAGAADACTFSLAWPVTLYYPYGVAVDASGNVYQVAGFGPPLSKWSSVGSPLGYVVSQSGNATGELAAPSDVAVDPAGNLYVTSESDSQPSLKKFDAAGMELWRVPAPDTPSGPANGQFSDPYGVAVNGSGSRVYVADGNNNRVQVFDPNGLFQFKWGSFGSGNGQFFRPQGIAVAPSGDVFVADTFNYRIQKFDASGNFLLAWGSEGSGDGQFGGNAESGGPWAVDVDAEGRVYVTDYMMSRVQVFDGDSGAYLGKFGSSGTGPGQFSFPIGLAVDGSSGDVYVTDFVNAGSGTDASRIQKFGPCDFSCADSDGDEVCADQDACPGLAGPPDRQGCPAADVLTFNVRTVGLGPATLAPIGGAELRVYDQDDAAFVSAYGTGSLTSALDVIYEGGVGRVGSCVTGSNGGCTAGEPLPGNYLVIGVFVDASTARTVYTGKSKATTDFVNGVAALDLTIMKKFENGVFEQYLPPGQIKVVGP